MGLITFDDLRRWSRERKRKQQAFRDQIPGGKADKLNPSDFDQTQLDVGIKEEMEHTNSTDLATEIAMDHLSQDPDYYKKLKKYVEKDGSDQRGQKMNVKTEIQYKGVTYRLAEEGDQKAEEAKSDIGKVRERIKGALGLVHDKKWDEAGKLLEELLKDLEEAKEDVKEEAKK